VRAAAGWGAALPRRSSSVAVISFSVLWPPLHDMKPNTSTTRPKRKQESVDTLLYVTYNIHRNHVGALPSNLENKARLASEPYK
jgi:hypothetical protein